VVIGDIDQDGYLLSRVGPLENAPTIPGERFLARMRHDLKVVAIDGFVGVKKDYRGDRLRFVKEARNLHRLGLEGCNVPAILDLDVDRLTLTISYILGSVLREELANRGAALRDRELRQNPEYLSLPKPGRESMRVREGRRVLDKVVGAQFVDGLFAELRRIHAAGLEGNDIKYGNVIKEKRTGQPYWVDFEEPIFRRPRGGFCGSLLRDRDIEKFNLFFGTEKLTYETLWERVKGKQALDGDGCEVPVYFGCGLHLGSLWDVKAGYGFWHSFLKYHLPDPSGWRILDLGGSNAFYVLQMLRHGARKVVGVEAGIEQIAQASFVQAAFEWADSAQYNLELIQAERASIPDMNLGTFDLVVGLSPWLDPAPDAMPSLIRHLSTVAKALVLQIRAGHHVRAGHGHGDGHPLLEAALQVIKGNGFPEVQVMVPHRRGHPVVMAQRDS
jgi:hypothetical protein